MRKRGSQQRSMLILTSMGSPISFSLCEFGCLHLPLVISVSSPHVQFLFCYSSSCPFWTLCTFKLYSFLLFFFKHMHGHTHIKQLLWCGVLSSRDNTPHHIFFLDKALNLTSCNGFEVCLGFVSFFLFFRKINKVYACITKKHNNTDTQKNTAQLLSPCLLLLWKAAPCHARTQTHTCTHPPQKPLHQQCYRSGAVSHCSCDTELVLWNGSSVRLRTQWNLTPKQTFLFNSIIFTQ